MVQGQGAGVPPRVEGSHGGFQQGWERAGSVGNVPLGPEWEVGRGRTGAKTLWVSSCVRLGRTSQALGVALPPGKGVLEPPSLYINVQTALEDEP